VCLEELVPARVIAISLRSAEASARLDFYVYRLGLGEEIQREAGLEVAPMELGATPNDGRRLLPPYGPAAEQRMAAVLGGEQASILFEHARERGLRHASCGEAAIEEGALNAGGREHCIYPKGDAAHRIG